MDKLHERVDASTQLWYAFWSVFVLLYEMRVVLNISQDDKSLAAPQL